MSEKFKKICLLKGGDSQEREVSLESAKAFAQAVKELGYDLVEFDFTGDPLPMIQFIKQENPDCILNGFHGGSGENGTIPAILNLLKIPYTHSGVLASALGMNKYISGLFFEKNGIKTPRTILRNWNDFLDNPQIDIDSKFVIKPVSDGSSNGVYILEDLSFLSTINWEFGNDVLIEEYIPGLELTVGVMGDHALEVTQINIEHGFYDYQHKYSVGAAVHEIPAKIPDSIRKEAMETAVKVHQLCGCRGVSRCDFRYNDVTNELYLLELNTHPGMTSLSLVPEQARYIGISFRELVEWIIEQACYD